MTNISYMICAEDRPRVMKILALLTQGMEKQDALHVLAHCSNWTEEQIFGEWPDGMSLAAHRRGESEWRRANSKASRQVAGLICSASEDAPSLVDLLVAGLFLLDHSEERVPLMCLSHLSEVAERLKRQASPTRAIVSSSMGREGARALCGQEKTMVMTPRNQRDILAVLGMEPAEKLPWLVVLGHLNQATCRSLWRAREASEDLIGAADFQVSKIHDPGEVIAMLEGRTPVLYARDDYRDLTGTAHTFVDTVFLSKLVPTMRGYAHAPLGAKGLGSLAFMLGLAGRESAPSAEDMVQAFLRLVIEAVGVESRWHPPGSLARTIAAGDPLPDLCGPELTN